MTEPFDLETLFDHYRRHGDVAALGQLFDRAAPELYAVARHLARRPGDVDDLVQSAFATAIERAASFDAERRLMPWLLGMLAMHQRKVAERRGRWIDFERLWRRRGSVETPDDSAAAGELTRAVEAALAELRESDADLLRLHFEGLRPRELADRFGIAAGTARVRLHRALRRLRDALPAGLAGGAAVTALPDASQAAVRARVVAHGARVAGGAATGIDTLAGSLAGIAAAGTVAFVLVAASGAGASHATASLSPITESSPPTVSARGGANTDSLVALEPARVPLARAQDETPPSFPGAAVVRGRFLLPDGRPAAGVALRLSGFEANPERVQRFGRPKAWENVEAESASDGSFELRFLPPRAYQFSLGADPSGYGALRWWWSAIDPGSETDLGVIELEPTGTIVGRLVDGEGRALTRGWYIQATTAAAPGPHRRATQTAGTFDESTGEFRIEGVPVGRATVHANAFSTRTDERSVEVAADREAFCEIVYEGPDPMRRVTLIADPPRWLLAFLPDDAFRCIDAAGEVHQGRRNGRSWSWFFEDLPAGPFRLEVAHESIVPWSENGVELGALRRMQVVGSAALRLTVTDRATEHALPGAELFLIDQNDEAHALTADAEQASVYRGLAPRPETFEVRLAGRMPVRRRLTSLAAGDVAELAFAIEPALALEGRVVATDGVSPEFGVRVELTRGDRPGYERYGWGFYAEFPEPDRFTVTDDDGRFRFDGLSPGEHTVLARWSTTVSAIATRDLSHDAAGEGELVLRLPAAGHLEGRVLLPDGRSVEELWFGFEPKRRRKVTANERNEFVDGSIDPDGHFRFGPLPVGEVRVRCVVAARSRGFTNFGTIDLGRVTISEGATASLDVDLRERFPATLVLEIGINGGVPSAGKIVLLPDDAQTEARRPKVHPADVAMLRRMNSPSNFVNIPPGRYRLQYTAPEGRWAWLAAEPIELASGEELSRAFDIELVKRKVHFIDAGTGTPLANARVGWTTGHSDSAARASRETDEAGALELELPRGQVTFYRGFEPSAPDAVASVAWAEEDGSTAGIALR